MTTQNQAYFEMNGYNTWRDFGLRMFERSDDPAPPKLRRESVPKIQGTIDLSRGDENEMYFEDTILHYGFKRVIKSQNSRENLKQRIKNAFHHHTDGVLFDSVGRYYEHSKVVVTDMYFSDMKDPLFIVQIDFIAYPFKKHIYNEGHDIWNAFSLDYGTVQDVEFVLPNLTSSQLPFKQLSVGDMVILGAWTTVQSVGIGNDIQGYETEQFYEIVGKRSATNDPSSGWYGDTEYQLDNGYWVRDQNIVQARNVWLDIRLFNKSKHAITPRITHLRSNEQGPAWRGITIQRDNNYYNLRGDIVGQNEYDNDSFRLLPGENNFRVYGQNNAIKFVWQLEVL